jgi:hypothetical protein
MVPARPPHAEVDGAVRSPQRLEILGIHAQRMENRGTFARLLSHMLSFLPVIHGKASGRCRARRGSRSQTRKEVSNQRRQQRRYCISEVRLANRQPNATLD